MECGGGGYNYWWRKRILAVVLPYAVAQLTLYWPFHEFSLLDFVLDIFCLKPLYGNGWYLSYLILWYILFYAVRRLFAECKQRIVAFAALAVLSFFCFTFFMKSPIRAEQSFSFFTGILLSETKKTEFVKRRTEWKSAAVLLAVGVVFLAIKQIPVIRESPDILMNTVQLLIKLPAGLGLMLLVWLLSQHINLNILACIGLFSYELYIIHGYILSVVPVDWIGAIVFIAASFASAIVYHVIWKYLKDPIKILLRMQQKRRN